MFADVAVAVHPRMSGTRADRQTAALAFTDREIPVIADEYVDQSSARAASRLPRARSQRLRSRRAPPPRDASVHRRRWPTERWPGRYQGMSREEGALRRWRRSEEQGFLSRSRGRSTHAVGHCSRCDTVVEPFLSDQWFVRMEPLAKPALEAVSGRNFGLSRALRKGVHSLAGKRPRLVYLPAAVVGPPDPAWYCEDCQGMTVEQDRSDRSTPLRADSPGRGRPGHLVFVWHCGRFRPWGGRMTRPTWPVLPNQHARDRLRHSVLLGCSHGVHWLLSSRARCRSTRW